MCVWQLWEISSQDPLMFIRLHLTGCSQAWMMRGVRRCRMIERLGTICGCLLTATAAAIWVVLLVVAPDAAVIIFIIFCVILGATLVVARELT